ncbi:MAG: hypothetical protein NVS2B7_16340 [Herpetosiphon sp.]
MIQRAIDLLSKTTKPMRDTRTMYTMTCLICNSLSIEQTLHVEPWGEQYKMAPNISFEIVGKGATQGQLIVEFADKGIFVFAWVGGVVSVFHNCIEISPSRV